MSGDHGPSWAGWSVMRPVATWMIIAAVLVLGWISFSQLPLSLTPELSYPTITVRVEYPGAAPQEVEREIVDVIEDMVGTVEGVRGLESIARSETADVLLRFEWGSDLDQASQKVRERLAMARLPDEATRPLVLRYDPTLDPILRFSLSAPRGEVGGSETESSARMATLRRLADDELSTELEGVDGVANVQVLGGRERLVLLDVDAARLRQAGVTLAELNSRLAAENINVAGGRLDDGQREYMVRTLNEFSDIHEIRDTIIRSERGRVVRVGDVATLRFDSSERVASTQSDGEPSVEVSVYKEADANLVAVSEALMERIESLREEGELLDQGVEVRYLANPAVFVRAAIDEVMKSALYGALCAVLVLFIFLRRLSVTLIVGLSIPLSVVAVFTPLRAAGVSLNVMSLGGLALGIGMLVDNAIVVLEAIVRRQELGEAPVDAALNGSGEVLGAVTASTLTSVAVFGPIIFIEGVAGQLFGDLAWTVVLSLLASLGVAIWFVPMAVVLVSRILGGERSDDDTEQARTRAEAVETRGQDGTFKSERLLGLKALATGRDDLRALRTRWLSAGVFGRVLWTALGGCLVPWIVLRTLFAGLFEVVFSVLFSRLFRVIVLGIGGLGALFAVAWRASGDRLLAGVDHGFERLKRVYRLGLRGTLRRPAWLVLLLGGSLVALLTRADFAVQLMPEMQEGRVVAELYLPVGTPLEETEALLQNVQREALGWRGVQAASSFAGRRVDDLDASGQGDHYGELLIALAPSEDFVRGEARVIHRLNQALARVPDLRFQLRSEQAFQVETPVEVRLFSSSVEDLRSASLAVVAALEGLDGVRSASSSAVEGQPELRVRFNRADLARRGLDTRGAAAEVRAHIQGDRATRLQGRGRALDVVIRSEDARHQGLEALGELAVGHQGTLALPVGSATTDGVGASMFAGAEGGGTSPVLLSSVGEVEEGVGPVEIRHFEGQRVAYVFVDVAIEDLRSMETRTREAMGRVTLPTTVRWELGGQSASMGESSRNLGFALLLAIFFVYVVIASRFESFLAPLLILGTLPLSFLSVGLALWLTQTSLSVVSSIGAIVLSGIIVNNGIVLVDSALEVHRTKTSLERSQVLAWRESVLEACEIRLRPVLITALTTILGLLPMVFQAGEGAELRQPLALVVASGLAGGTLLTLFVLPVLMDKLLGRAKD